MKERPILFSDAMVAAILAGRKTQTRRLIGPAYRFLTKGDRLWVREAWANADRMYAHHECDPPSVVAYRADRSAIQWDAQPPRTIPDYDLATWNWDALKWKPSIHMPRWASRITLEVTGARVELLQSITDADAMAEGIVKGEYGYYMPGLGADAAEHTIAFPRFAFGCAWNAINGLKASWDSNPAVKVIEFKRVDREREAA